MGDYVSIEITINGERRIITKPVRKGQSAFEVFESIRTEFAAIDRVSGDHP